MAKVVNLFPGDNNKNAEAAKKRKSKGKRDDGRYRVTLDLGGEKPGGGRNQKTFYGKTYKEACAKRDAYKALHMRGIDMESKLTVSQWLDEWLAHYKANVCEKTLESYKADANRLKVARAGHRVIGDMLLSEVRNAHLQAALDQMRGQSDSGIHKYKLLITQSFKKAKKNRLIPDNPAEDLDTPKGFSGSHRALDRWETDLIMDNWHRHRAGIWVMVMLLTGIRPGELFALKWKNVDLEARKITVLESASRKGNRYVDKDGTKSEAGNDRKIPICQPLYDALVSVPDRPSDEYVALSANNTQLTHSAARKGFSGFFFAMEKVLNGKDESWTGNRAGKKDWKTFEFQPHDLRHTFATALYDAGVDVKSAQYYLGHKNIQVTMNLYTHLSEEREKRGRAALVGFLDSWLKRGVKGPEDD